METQIPPKDNQKFHSRAAKLDWSKIAFGDYDAHECYEVWLAISKRVRRFRILSEILQDAREWVTKPWTNFYRGSKKVFFHHHHHYHSFVISFLVDDNNI